MHFYAFLALALVSATGCHAQTQYTKTDQAAIASARATARTLSPTSAVQGKSFNRFVNIWLENTDFSMAKGDPNLQWVAQKGITLTNYRAITHPSQPNYIASVGGDTHWVIWDFFSRISDTQPTIVDLLDAKGVSWSEYQEDLPFSGFQADYKNQTNGRNAYVRKHNPLISYDSVTKDLDRLAKIKNFTMFYRDLEQNKLPQWIQISPNMQNDGHDTSVTFAGAWTRSFLEPLLTNTNFMQDTLIVLTFDETENYFSNNQVFTVLLGDAVPPELHGTENSTAYNHYSNMATVERNWNLGNLGKKDASAKAYF